SILFSSCDMLHQPVRGYLEYWSSTCQVGKIEYLSPYTELDGVPNLSALNPVEINLYLANPKGYGILCKPGNAYCFSFKDEQGNTGFYSDYSEAALEHNTTIKVQAVLPDDTEGQTITLTGCIWPDNRRSLGFSEEQLLESFPELFYTTTFVQNTPPDNIKNLQRATDFFPGTQKCYIAFDLPDQNLNRNKDSTYEIKYFFRNDDNSLEFKGSRVLTLSDNKNPTSGSNIFMYYFDEQLDDFLTRYEYTVQVTGPRGLTADIRSTDPALGACVLVESEIDVLASPNGLYDEDPDGDYECYELESEGDAITFTADPGQEGDTLTVTDNGTLLTPTGGNTYTVSGSGRHEIKATSSRTDAFSVTVTKRIRISTTPNPATFSFGDQFNNQGEDDEGYEYIEFASESATTTYTITSPDSGTTLTGKIDGVDFTETPGPKTGSLNVAYHVLDAVVHKPFCNPVSSQKKVCVAKSLDEPSITTNPNPNGKTDGSGYAYYELASSSARLSYTIEPTSYDRNTNGAKVSGSVGTATFTETDKKTGNLATGTYIISGDVKRKGMVTKHFERKIKVVESLKDPVFACSKLTGNSSGGYEYIEISADSVGVSYSITSANPAGCTITGTDSYTPTSGSASTTNFDSSTATNTNSVVLTLGLGDHIITGTVHNPLYNDHTFTTKKVRVVHELQKPTIRFYKESAHSTQVNKKTGNPEDNRFLLYDTYNITLAADGTGYLYYTATTSDGSTITIKDDGTAITSGKLGLGPHNLTMEVSKTNYVTRKFDAPDKVYVEGLLAAPTFTPVGTKTGVSITGDTEYWQYSYIEYDEMPINVSVGNTGNTLEIHEDGHIVESASIGYNTAGSITAVQSREYCKTRSDESKWMDVSIKPITLTSTSIQVRLDGFGENSFNAKGIMSIVGPNVTKKVWDHMDDQKPVTQPNWCNLPGISTWSDTFTDPNQKIKVTLENFRRHRGGIHEDEPVFTSGTHEFPEITLSEIKAGTGQSSNAGSSWTYICDQKDRSGQKVQPKITFSASD
ncbi:MAG: hypothetical protein J6W60_07470, partial [Treponema sp.]|nr:hypothetical protein [Treponema sp.]